LEHFSCAKAGKKIAMDRTKYCFQTFIPPPFLYLGHQ
jgi:hypothetical protein